MLGTQLLTREAVEGVEPTSGDDPETSDCSTVRLQCATLTLLRSVAHSTLVRPQTEQAARHWREIVELIPRWFPIIVRPLLDTLPTSEHMNIFHRDRTFVELLTLPLLYDNVYVWINDVDDDPRVRCWIRVIDRWAASSIPNSAYDLSADLLSHCNRLYQAPPTDWGDDLPCAQRVAVVAICANWSSWSWNTYPLPVAGHWYAISRTLQALTALDITNARRVEKYINQIHTTVPTIQNRYPDLISALSPVVDVLEKLLDGLKASTA